MNGVLGFWLAVVVIGALALPIAYRFFRRFPDGGAGLSIALGVVLTSYAYFILRVLSVLPFGRGGFVLAVGLLALGSAWCVADARAKGKRFVPPLYACTAMLGLFSAFYFGMVAIRSETPDISGTEQPMDFLYLNAVLESPEYPPADPWLSGERASYYYFGYVQVGLLTGVSGVPASTGYNLGLAYTFAAAATGAASLALALARWAMPRERRKWLVAAAPMAVTMLLIAGTTAAAFEWAAAHGHASQGLFELFGLEHRISCDIDPRSECYEVSQAARTSHWYPDQFFFGSFFAMTRLIPGTIVEYPIFSFLLGDLHPHVTALPLVLLMLGMAAATWRGRGRLDWREWQRRPVETAIIALLIGALAFQNAWDILTFSFVFALAVLARNLAAGEPLEALKRSASYLGPIAAVAVVAYLPWYLDFSSQASGIYPYVGAGTSPAHAFNQWGALIVSAMLALAPLRRSDRAAILNVAPFAPWVPLLPLAAWAALASYNGTLGEGMDARTAAGWWTLAIYGVCVFALSVAAAVLYSRRSMAAIPAVLGATGILLLYGSELLFIRDVFFGSVPRLNTVFKLAYQAWVLLSIGGAVSIACAFGRASRSNLARGGAAFASVLVLVASIYALTGIPNRTNGFANEGSVDGLAGLARFDPDEYALVTWINANTAPGSVILEASGRTWRLGNDGNPVLGDQGTDYTDSGQIAARTGRSTVIGWYFHEVQWRGDVPEVRNMLSERQAAVDEVYLAGADSAKVLATLDRYGVSYVVVGRVEQAKYPQQTLPQFDGFLDLVFESGDLRIYAVPAMKVVPTS